MYTVNNVESLQYCKIVNYNKEKPTKLRYLSYYPSWKGGREGYFFLFNWNILNASCLFSSVSRGDCTFLPILNKPLNRHLKSWSSAKRKNESVIDLLRCWSTTVDTKAIDQLDLYLNSKADKMNAELWKKLKAVSLIFNVQTIVPRFLCDIFLFWINLVVFLPLAAYFITAWKIASWKTI